MGHIRRLIGIRPALEIGAFMHRCEALRRLRDLQFSEWGSFEPTADEWAVRETDDAVGAREATAHRIHHHTDEGALAVAGVVPHWRVVRSGR